MKMKITATSHTPNTWVVVEITHNNETIRKVFAGWSGGFVDGDSWKLSSGITSVKECDDGFEFTNISGSVYLCHKERQRMNGLQASILAGWQEALRDSEKTPIQIIEY